MIPSSLAQEPARREKQVRFVRFACLAILGILAVGLWAQMPYLVVEHGRLPRWKIFELWGADLLALAWFGRFAIEHAVLGEPLVAVPFADVRGQIRTVAIAGVTVLALELLLTFSLILDD